MMENILVSACLLGLPCRYDGLSKASSAVVKLLEHSEITLIPLCPEQLGGLATPRFPSERIHDRVMNDHGEDMTAFYHAGADRALRMAELYQVKRAILKAKSPSCGSDLIYDGSFSGKLIQGEGVTTELLRKQGILVASEKDFAEKFSDLTK